MPSVTRCSDDPSLHHFGQAASHFALQEAEHAADLLQRESLAPQFGDYRDFDHLGREVHAAMPLMPRRNHFPLIPPLQLPKTDLGNLRNFTRGIRPFLDAGPSVRLFLALNIMGRFRFG